MSVFTRIAWDTGELVFTGGIGTWIRHRWIKSCRWRPAVRGGDFPKIVVCRGVLRDPFRDSHIDVTGIRSFDDDAFTAAWARAEEMAMAMNVRRA